MSIATSARSIEKAEIQAGEYTLPYHWIGIDHNCLARYVALSREIANLIRAYATPGPGVDIGCGDGRSTFEVIRCLGDRFSILGLDYDARAIHFARLFAPEVEFRVGDAAGGLPLKDSSMTFLCCREVLEHVAPEETPAFVAEQIRVLKPRGVAVITVPSVNLKIPPKHYRHFDAQSLQEVYAAFEPLEIFGFGRGPKGVLSSGVYRVVDRLPGLWKTYRRCWHPTSPEEGDVLVACFRKPDSAGRRSDSPKSGGERAHGSRVIPNAGTAVPSSK